MSTFLKLPIVNADRTTQKIVFVNVDHVAMVREHGKGVALTIRTGEDSSDIASTWTMDELEQALAEAGCKFAG